MELAVTDPYYILTKAELAAALNISAATCAPGPSGAVDPASMAIAMALTRLEQVLEVGSLVRGTHREVFFTHRNRGTSDGALDTIRTRNAFITDDDLQITDPNGRAITPVRVDRYHGIVYCNQLQTGLHRIEYTAGFEADEDNVLQDVPVALKHIAINCALIWRRTGVLMPTAGKGVSYTMLVRSAIRELQTIGKGTYDRPRSPSMVWTDPE